MNKIKILVSGILIIVIVSLIIISFNFDKELSSEVAHSKENKTLFKINYSSENSIRLNCANLSLEYTVDCLVENIKPIFNYTETSDTVFLKFEEIKERGGDCRDWTMLYSRLIPTTFYKREVSMRADKKTSHIVLIISDSTGYCLLDMEDYDCWRFE